MPAACIAASSRWRRASASVVLAGITLLRRGVLGIVEAIVAPCGRRRYVALGDIVGDLAPAAQARIAPAAAAGGAEDQAVARLHRYARRLEEPLFAAVAPHQHGFVDGTGAAAVEPPGRVLGAFAIHVGE